ncbi:HEPN domain-containing protein [Cellulomonas xiejunii]|uniref:HEPN domain-containing protein n=1 Tax=Cellulomonas xiejunii TaxID=2968083 RepID=UPI001D0F4047|nr:HEPN domain-containing protein [Cellulomonas xiejunii]MCC2315605.1 hypothetical protein [Cellulomonas xiejunii]
MSTEEALISQFHADLAKASELLRLVKLFRAFAGSDQGCAEWPEANALYEAAPGVRTDLPVLSGSLLLYVCGRFEFFARELVVLVADEMAAKAGSYSDLPARVQKELRSRTLDVAANASRYNYKEEEVDALLVTLGTNLASKSAAAEVASDGSAPEEAHVGVLISPEILAITTANLRPDVLAEIFRRVDVSELWLELGKQAGLRTYLSERDERECTAEAKRRLNALMEERNSIAHPTGSTRFPDPDQVLNSVEFLKVLSRVMVDVVKMSI